MISCKDCIHYGICCLWSTTDLDGEESYKYCFGNYKPAADVVEVRHGEWKDVGEHYCQCSICTTMFEALPTKSSFKADNIFCRHCGAKMDGGAK